MYFKDINISYNFTKFTDNDTLRFLNVDVFMLALVQCGNQRGSIRVQHQTVVLCVAANDLNVHSRV